MSSTTAPATSPLTLVSAQSLNALVDAFTSVLGDEGATLLRDAGFTTGVALAAQLRERQATREAPRPEELPRSIFIAAATDIFREAGWGEMEVDPSRSDLTVLDVREWTERSASGAHFTTGMLAGFFGAIAGEELAVLEVDPPDQAPGRTRFLMGSVSTVNDLFTRLDSGESVDALLGSAG